MIESQWHLVRHQAMHGHSKQSSNSQHREGSVSWNLLHALPQAAFLQDRKAARDMAQVFAAWRKAATWCRRARQTVGLALAGMALRGMASTFAQWGERAKWQVSPFGTDLHPPCASARAQIRFLLWLWSH